ncbi:hypothetical protein M2158_007712 [Streptomyces sp. SAI-144]|nr:hypothetical protein [Streptomyces sp. SAI-144]
MPSTEARTRSPPTVASTVSGASTLARSTSTANSTTPTPCSTVTSGRTRAIRAVDHRSRRTGRQIPAVTSVGPQSQPNEQAILRRYWYGSAYAAGRSPSFPRTASASA